MGTPPFFTIPPGCAIASWRPPSWNNWNNYSQNNRSILLLMLPSLSPSIREIIQTGRVKVVRIMMVKLRVYLKVYNRTEMRPNIRSTFAKLRMHSRVNT